MFERLKKTTKALVYGRENISPNVDKFMRDPVNRLEITFREIINSRIGSSP